MTQGTRKEIIQLNGLIIVVIMTLVANFLVAGFIYRYHGHQLFIEEKRHNLEMDELSHKQEHALKEEITTREGVTNWNQTAYMHNLQIK